MARWFAGRVQRDANGELFLTIGSDDFYELPRSKAFRGITVYLVGDIPWSHMVAELCREGDSLYASGRKTIGSIKGIRVKCAGNNGWNLADSTDWGYRGDSIEDCETWLEGVEEGLEVAGMKWGKSASVIAGRITREALREVRIRPTPPRVRGPARRALTPGPMVVIKGHSESAVEVDRKGAFLNSLRAPVPIPGSWRSSEFMTVGQIVTRPGIVRGTVYVPPEIVANIPPLWVESDRLTTAYPTGYVRGTWDSASLERALDLGCRLEGVEWGLNCKVSPILSAVADAVEDIPSKRIRKLAYTRIWGRFAGAGGWRGLVVTGDSGRNRIAWSFSGTDDERGRAHKMDYRPDWSLFVASDNTRHILDAAENMPKGKVVGAHVDCLFVEGEGPELVDRAQEGSGVEWAVKGSGELRQYAVGIRSHGEVGVCSGVRGVSTKAELELAISSGRATPSSGLEATATNRARRWFQGTPGNDAECFSLPRHSGDRYKPVGRSWLYDPWDRFSWRGNWPIEEGEPWKSGGGKKS